MQKFVVDPSEVLVIYDFDEILYPLTATAAEIVGVELSDWHEYYAHDNNFTADQVAQLEGIFQDPNFYRVDKFFPGVADILRPQVDFGVKVMVKTHVKNEKEAERKTDCLIYAVPGFKPENIECQPIILNVPSAKELPPGTFAFADDLPRHLVNSTARVNVTRWWPWNTSPAAKKFLTGTKYVGFDSLERINRFIYHRTYHYLCEGV